MVCNKEKEQVVRVTLVEPFFNRAGHFSEEVVALGNALTTEGAEVEVITPAPVKLATLHSSYARVPGWLMNWSEKTSGVVQAILDCFTIWICARAAVKNAGSDSVLVFVSGRLLAFFLIAAVNKNRALVFFSRDFSRLWTPSRMDRLLRGPTRFMANLGGKRNRVSLISIVDPNTAEGEDSFGLPMVYIPPVGVRTYPPSPSRNEAREQLGLPLHVPTLLVFGVAHIGKDYEIIFQALQHLRNPLKVVIAGAVLEDFPEHPRALKKRFDDEDRIIIRDEWIPREDVRSYFAAADGLLLSYRPGYVVDSGVLCEGVALDCLMVGNEEGSIGQALTDWPLGLTFPAGDPESLAKQMQTLTALSANRLEEYREGRSRFKEHYSWDRIAQEHLALYRELIIEI